MQKRHFVFNNRKSSPEFTGDVRSDVEVDRDGAVRVTTTLSTTYEDARTRFDWPAGRIIPWSTQSGLGTVYHYEYPSGHGHPGIFQTVRAAAHEAAIHAASTFARSLAVADAAEGDPGEANEPPMHPGASLTGGTIPAHYAGAYPNLSCCGGPVKLVEAAESAEQIIAGFAVAGFVEAIPTAGLMPLYRLTAKGREALWRAAK